MIHSILTYLPYTNLTYSVHVLLTYYLLLPLTILYMALTLYLCYSTHMLLRKFRAYTL